MDCETEPPAAVIAALTECAREAAKLKTVPGLALAGRLYVKAWDLQHGRPASEPAADDGDLLEWAAAERASR
jgi:hypothetical protein